MIGHLPNQIAAKTDPRDPTPVGFGGVLFRRVFVGPTSGEAPDWLPAPNIIAHKIPGGPLTRRYDIGRGPDTLSLDVEVDSTADAAALRALVGTAGTLTLPAARYDDGDYGTAAGYPDGKAYRTQTALLVSVDASAITIRQTVRLSLSFERDAQ
jgi:hypothetical protein